MISLTSAVFSWLPAHARSGEQGSTLCLCACIQAPGNAPAAPGQLIPQKYHCACFRGDKRHNFCCQGLNNNKKATAVTTSGCVKVTPKASFASSDLPCSRSLSQHTLHSCKNSFPPSITQPVPVTQEKSLSVRMGLFILIPHLCPLWEWGHPVAHRGPRAMSLLLGMVLPDTKQDPTVPKMCTPRN